MKMIEELKPCPFLEVLTLHCVLRASYAVNVMEIFTLLIKNKQSKHGTPDQRIARKET